MSDDGLTTIDTGNARASTRASAAGLPADGERIGSVGPFDLYLFRDFAGVEPFWRAFQDAAVYTPFQDVDWLKAWVSVAPMRQHDLRIFIICQDTLPMAIVPLDVVRQLGLRQLEWMAQDLNDYNAPVMTEQLALTIEPGHCSAIWAMIVSACSAPDLVKFVRQPATLAGLPNCLMADGAVPSSSDSHVQLLQGNWTEHYARLRSAKSRRRLREKERKLAGHGKVQFRGAATDAEREALIRQAVSWKSEQLARSGDRNPFAGNLDANLLVSVLKQLAKSRGGRHKLRVDSLYLSGKAVATIVALVDQEAYSVFITAHAGTDLSRYSPGQILFVKTMQLAVRAGLTRYDFLAGDEAYKMDWCDHHVGLFDSVIGHSVTGGCAASVIRNLLRAKRSIKQTPAAMNLLKSINRQRSKSG